MKIVWTSIGLAVATSALAQSSDPLAPMPAPIERPLVQSSQPPVTVHRQPVAAYVPISSQPFAVSDFDRYKPRLVALARAGGVSESTIAAVFPALSLNGRVIALDQSQPGQVRNPNYTPPFAPYRREHVTADLIRRGADRYRTYWSYLSRIEQRFGVPSSIMLAIYGHETSYGSVTGGFDIVQALATLAYEGRRRPLFESEFVAALRLIDLGIPRWRLKGSYAGATGLPQFMPSAVIRLRTDGDGDGRADIWTNEIDGLASIGNFLQQSGWRRGLLWGVPVRVPAGFDRNAVRRLAVTTDCPRVHARHSRPLSMAQWRALGVVPLDRSLAEGDLATLFEPDGPGQTAYLVTDNYRAILKYNCSNFYAMSVGLLADRIIGR